MGSTAKFGLLVLMALIIALARFLESEVKPQRAQVLSIAKTAPSSPGVSPAPSPNRVPGPADLVVSPAISPVTPISVPPVAEPQKRTYKVRKRKGEVLSRISQEVYGSQRYWRVILKANRSQLKGDPRKLRPGMVLIIPPKPQR